MARCRLKCVDPIMGALQVLRADIMRLDSRLDCLAQEVKQLSAPRWYPGRSGFAEPVPVYGCQTSPVDLRPDRPPMTTGEVAVYYMCQPVDPSWRPGPIPIPTITTTEDTREVKL